MSDPFASPPGLPYAPSGYPAPLPPVRDLFALIMTGATAGLVGLILVADLVVLLHMLLLHHPIVGLVGLLSVVAPLYTVLVGAFTCVVNYVVRRKPRGGQLEYDGYSGYDSYDAVQAPLTGRSRRLLAVSVTLLLVSLPLAAVPYVPSTTPLIGALGSWQGQNQAGGTVVLVGTPATADVGIGAVAPTTTVPTSAETPAATTNTNTTAVPTATARPTAAATATKAAATATPTSGPLNFTVFPLSASYSSCATNTAVPFKVLTLDNSRSAVAINWQVSSVDNLPGGGGVPWATILDAAGTPITGGTVAAGAHVPVTLSPDPAVCQSSHPPPAGKSWQLSIAAAGSTFTFVYAVS